MKRSFLSKALLAILLLSPLLVAAQKLTIQAEDGKTTDLGRADIESLPHVKVTIGEGDSQTTYDAVPLKTLLEKVGISLGDSLRGKRMASCLLVEAADDYRVVIALPEIDPDFTDKQVVLAFLRDGKPLDAKEGPYRIIFPDEKRKARWVRQVTTLKIVDVK